MPKKETQQTNEQANPQKQKWQKPELLKLNFNKTENSIIGPNSGDGAGPSYS